MPWARFHFPLTCGSCGVRIPRGAAVYVTKARMHICEGDALRIVGEVPPADLPVLLDVPTPIVETTVASEMSRFDRPGMRRRLWQNVLDARQRQAGER